MINKKTSTLVLSLLLLTSFTVIVLSESTKITNAQTTDDLLQYEWSTPNGDPQYGFRAGGGPAPDTLDIVWTSDLGKPVAAFNGMVFLTSGWAVDAFTGDPIYQYTGGAPTKINEEIFVTTADPSPFELGFFKGLFVNDIETGELLAQYDIQTGPTNYNPELGMFWTLQGDPFWGMNHEVYGWDWPDPLQEPTLKWEKFIQKGITWEEIFDGYVFLATPEMTCICLDGETGDFLWEIPLEGYFWYPGAYYEGKYIHSTFEDIYCIEAATGEVLWTYSPGTFWNFFADMGAIYNGVLYVLNSDYHTYAIDIETGEVVWKFKSEQGVGYQGPTIAGGGYVYAYTGRWGYTDPDTGEPFDDEYVCLDAETGEFVWKTDTVSSGGIGGGGPPGIADVLAYGNLYLQSTLAPCVCYGPPQPWSGFKANPENTGDGYRNGPSQLEPKWISRLDSAILTSPIAAENKIFVGTVLGTLYAIDPITGDTIWTFKTEEKVKLSSAAYDRGKVYFVSDDGYQYCIDADNGEELWKTYIGSDVKYYYHGLFRKTSSPTVVNGRVYVGSRNFKIYCLNAITGDTIWVESLGGLISSTPAVSDGAVYVPVGSISEINRNLVPGDNGTLYKLDANTGNTIWETALPYVNYQGPGQTEPKEFHGSPCVAEGMVFQSANAWTTYGVNATTGQIVWNYTKESGGMLNDITPAYSNGKLFVQSFFSLACLDAFNGTKLWEVWAAHAIHGDPIIAFDKVYFASDFKVLYCVDIDTGEKISFYKLDDSIAAPGCVYDNKLYWGTTGMKVICFEEPPYGETTYYGTFESVASEMLPSFAQSESELESDPIESEELEESKLSVISVELGIIIVVAIAATIGISTYLLSKRK